MVQVFWLKNEVFVVFLGKFHAVFELESSHEVTY